MQLPLHALIGSAKTIPIVEPTPVVSYSPVVLPSPGRPTDLQLRVVAPAIGEGPSPIILLAHGHGPSLWLSSLDGYQPLAEFYAAHGFVVLQPTFLSSRFLSLEATTGQELFWESRARDMVFIIDNLDAIERTVPTIANRLDRDRIAVVGHSLGAWTANMLLGASNTDPRFGTTVRIFEPRIKAGVSLAGPGAGKALSESGKLKLPFYNPDFSTMVTPALVVYGDKDHDKHQFLTIEGPEWHADPYTQAPGPKSLFTVAGGMHGLGGCSGPDAAENAAEESPQRLAALQRMSWAYLRSQLFEGDNSWEEALKALKTTNELGWVETK